MTPRTAKLMSMVAAILGPEELGALLNDDGIPITLGGLGEPCPECDGARVVAACRGHWNEPGALREDFECNCPGEHCTACDGTGTAKKEETP